jgi:hypothetical protein
MFLSHPADTYFKQKLTEPMSAESRKLLINAKAIRHSHPDLSGPELVRLIYWGASGSAS